MRPKILIAGIGETGSELVQRLCLDWEVVVVDRDADALGQVDGIDCGAAKITAHLGDATSALVLRKMGVGAAHAAVACTGSDEVNLEFLRIARDDLGIENLFALMYSLDWEEQYRAAGVERISQDYACAAILEARVQRGQKVATGVGLGEGEIVEVEVLPNSSVIGRPLAELRPRRWLVGAVYRDRALIVPHGDTVLEDGDRVLIIGDPEILPSIATLIRTGESEFPLQYGSHVVSIFNAKTQEVLDEAAYLIESTRAEILEVVACNANQKELDALVETCERRGVPCESSCTAGSTAQSLVEEARHRDVGVLILPNEPMSFWARIGLRTTQTGRLFQHLHSPVLISRRSHPYRRILIALAELPFHTTAAQLAIDIARMVGAELHLAVVHQPEIVAGAELKQEVEQQRREIENLAGMYHVKIRTQVMHGNPIREVIEQSRNYELVVLPYRRGRKAFLTRPNVGLNLIHLCACSVLVMPC